MPESSKHGRRWLPLAIGCGKGKASQKLRQQLMGLLFEMLPVFSRLGLTVHIKVPWASSLHRASQGLESGHVAR